MSVRCSIVVPVHGHAGLTRQCLDTILREPPATPFEIVVVDDASTDDTPAVLASFGDAIRVIRHEENGGFARSCNDGAAAAAGEYLVFLNNDTIPQAGWLDALVAEADGDPAVAVVGSKLLFPNDTIQHAGVVICQDANPRHVYAGFPSAHPAVNKRRSLQAVTAASMLVRRDAFERAGGFDVIFRNCLEDTDLCLRLRALDYEVRYRPDSVLYHLESVSRGRRSKEIAANGRLFRERWADRAERDDLRIYVEDGLLRVSYRDLYPLAIELAPELATVLGTEGGRLVELQARQVADLLRETVRLSAHAADIAVSAPEHERPPAGPPGGHEELVAEAERLQLEIHDFQAKVAATASSENGAAPRFEPGEGLGYVKLRSHVRDLIAAVVPAGATVAVVSRGDEELLALEGRRGWHFPQEGDGTFAGRYPEDSSEAIEQLEALRARGATHFAVPETYSWWLEHYDGLGRHLAEHAEALTVPGAPCRVFRLER